MGEKIDKRTKTNRDGFFQENKRTLLVALFLIVFGDIEFIQISNDLITFGTLLIYGVFIHTMHLSSRITFLFCLLLMMVLFVNFITSGTSVPTEKTAVWLVLFMAVGVFQQWRELR